MSRFVVDASVATKWFLNENYDRYALRVRAMEHVLIAPELFLSEIMNAMLKAYRRGDVEADDVRLALTDLRAVVHIAPSIDLVEPALRLALEHQRSAYDALYVALALREQCPLVTADRGLYDAIGALAA